MSWFVLFVAFMYAALGLCVIVHEFGHWCAFRLYGVHVTSVVIGVGPVLRRWSRDGTDIVIRWFPFSGCVEPMEDDSALGCMHLNLGQRLTCMGAGTFVNAVVGFALLAFAGWVRGDVDALTAFALAFGGWLFGPVLLLAMSLWMPAVVVAEMHEMLWRIGLFGGVEGWPLALGFVELLAVLSILQAGFNLMPRRESDGWAMLRQVAWLVGPRFAKVASAVGETFAAFVDMLFILRFCYLMAVYVLPR